MYNSSSRFFSEAFKQKAVEAIKKQIVKAQAMSEDEFASSILPDYSKMHAHSIKHVGHRWKDADRVFQGLVSELESRVVRSGGPGMMTESLAQSLEAMFMLPTCGYMFDVVAAEALKRAAKIDQWYEFEKQWD